MKLAELSKQYQYPEAILEAWRNEGIRELRPAQTKAIKAGLLKGKNLLICTPTASGKTLVAALAALKTLQVSQQQQQRVKIVYIVPLVALAREKYEEFKRLYGRFTKVALSVGDFDNSDPFLAEYDWIVCTAEKLDSLVRHRAPWLGQIGLIIVDEVHLLNDSGRGPVLEILITLLRSMLPKAQLIALSATIGNAREFAQWLDAELVQDDWRPVPLRKGLYTGKEIVFDS